MTNLIGGDAAAVKSVGGPVGLGGWLILPIIGIVLTPILGVVSLMQSLPDFRNLGYLEPLQGGFVVFETAFNALLQLVAPVVLMVFLFGRRLQFPRLYQIFLATNLVWVILDLALAYGLFQSVFATGQAAFWDRETIRALVQAIVGCAIWIPYMSMSVRVKNTFVN